MKKEEVKTYSVICKEKEDSDNINLYKTFNGCGSEVKITLNDIIPGREYGYFDEESLEFYFRCPICKKVSKIDSDILTKEEKEYLMRKYSKVADYYKQIWKLSFEISKYEEEIGNKIDCLYKKIYDTINKRCDCNTLYDGWESNSKVLEEEEKLKNIRKRIKK